MKTAKYIPGNYELTAYVSKCKTEMLATNNIYMNLLFVCLYVKLRCRQQTIYK